MARLTFYDGTNCIGGTKILLNSKATNIMLDFGLNFSAHRRFFDEFLNARPIMGTHDLLDLGLLPPIRGIYRNDYEIPERKVWDRLKEHPLYQKIELQGILLSHAHLDHNGCIPYLDRSVPIYSSLTTAIISKAMQDVGGLDTCYLKPREIHDGLLRSIRKGICEQRQFIALNSTYSQGTEDFWTYSSWQINVTPLKVCESNQCKFEDLEIKFWPVDHSIPGSGAFAINTDAGWIIYSGDLRLHGERAEKTREFIAEAAKLRPSVLLIEGTHPETEKPTSESEVNTNISEVIKNAKGLVVADFGPRNIERLQNFLRATREANRKLAILAKDAYLLEALSCTDPNIRNPLNDENIVIYVEAKGTRQSWEKDIIEKWLYHDTAKVVTANTVHKNQDEYILCFSYFDIHELLDISPNGGTYIYSSSESYSEEMHADMDRLRYWLSYFGLKLVGNPGDRAGKGRQHGFHASGHIHGGGLKELVESINSDIVIPIHTESPNWFKQEVKGKKLIFPDCGETFNI